MWLKACFDEAVLFYVRSCIKRSVVHLTPFRRLLTENGHVCSHVARHVKIADFSWFYRQKCKTIFALKFGIFKDKFSVRGLHLIIAPEVTLTN